MSTPTTLHDEAPETSELPTQDGMTIATHNGRDLIRWGFRAWAAEVIVIENGRLVGYMVTRLTARPVWHHVAVFPNLDEAEGWLDR